MKILNIGVLTERFIDWGGGVDFIRLFLNGLTAIEQSENLSIKIFVYVPKISENRIKIKNFIKYIANQFLTNKLPYQKNIGRKYFVDLFKSINAEIEVVLYHNSEIHLSKLTREQEIDYLLPSFIPLSDTFTIKWAGYIFDFQHKYYPEFFTPTQIEIRDEQFLAMLNNAKTIVVNALQVKEDLDKFLGPHQTRVVALPFCPVLNMKFFEQRLPLSYGLPKHYFMISNQFWKHKDHKTAIIAFGQFLDNRGDKNFGLVCTGQTHDDRFPNYFHEIKRLISDLKLEKNIYILGYIPKIDQLQILKDTIGVIQPTLFEGGPGGGAIYESVAYGIPSIVSDIAVNREINDETVTFFKSRSAEDLALKMEKLVSIPKINYTQEYLIYKNKVSLNKMGNVILRDIILNSIGETSSKHLDL